MLIRAYVGKNPQTGSWTAVLTAPDGTACMVAAGANFQTPKPGEPA